MLDETLLSRHRFRHCSTDAMPMGHQWVKNSCYLDTVMWVMFSSYTPFVDNKILFAQPTMEKLQSIASCGQEKKEWNETVFTEFQMQFRKAAYFFRCGVGSKDCSPFRKLFKKWYEKCPLLQSKAPFHSSEQQEAQEFLQFLLSLYGMNGKEKYGAVSQEEFYYGVSKSPRADTVWTFVYDRKDKTQSLVWNIPYTVLRNTTSSERTLGHFLTRHDDIWNIARQHKHCHFNAMRTVHSLVRFADFMVFSLERTHPLQQTVSHFRVQIPETLTDTRGKTLSLFGIICHHGEDTHSGHYTAFRKSSADQQWYYYDDMNLPIQLVGGWQELMSIRHVASHSVLLFYTV